MNDKITSQHLQRAAYVYIRQSTLQQVRNNLESGRRQYALEDRARALGYVLREEGRMLIDFGR